MKRRLKHYQVELTYRDGAVPDLDPEAYKRLCIDGQRDAADIAVAAFKTIGTRHVKALMQSVRRHARDTKKGIGWHGSFEAYLSCRVGFRPDIRDQTLAGAVSSPRIHDMMEFCDRQRSKAPTRAHIHLFVYGSPGSTIAKYIRNYWELTKGLGFAPYEHLSKEKQTWCRLYAQEQSLGIVRGTFGGKLISDGHGMDSYSEEQYPAK